MFYFILLQHLFYFIAHDKNHSCSKINAAIKQNKTFILLQHLFYFIA